ncbi:MAG: site-specific integrase [Neomegalonema sp.]|nr:site-specific integrase [Neomegalonema sp.]
MPQQKLTKKKVESLVAAETDLLVWDEALPGFGVRVKPSGVRSYIVQYRSQPSGTSRRMTLGKHGPLLSFEQARKQARAILADAQRGEDPADERHKARRAPTMAQLAEDYLERHARPNKRPKSVRDDEAMLRNHILPALACSKVEHVSRRDIEKLHLKLKEKPYLANRVLSLLSKMFNLAKSWHWQSDNPATGIPKYPEAKRQRWLSNDELSRIVEILEQHPNRRAADAVLLQLLTGARIGEVLSARVQDIDLTLGVWTKASHQTKQKRTEHLPLSAQAVALLADIMTRLDAGEAYLFPGDRPGRPLTSIKLFWCSVLRQAGITDYRIHDNRHTYASHLVSSGLSLEIVGRLLGHTQAATTQRYAHLADDPLRAATERFATKMGELKGKNPTATSKGNTGA